MTRGRQSLDKTSAAISNMKVGFLTRDNRLNGSTRVRALQFVPFLEKTGCHVRVLQREVKTDIVNRVLFLKKALKLARWADVVFLQKPNLSGTLVDIIHAVNPRLIVDIDDAVWCPPPGTKDPSAQVTNDKFSYRLRYAIKRCGFAIAGNNYIAKWVRNHCPGSDVTVIPPSVDLEVFNRIREFTPAERTPTVGWIGSAANLFDLKYALPALRNLCANGKVKFSVISSEQPDCEDIPYEFRKWSLETEVEALSQIDIGIMPLGDDERSRGRCGYKAVQYMAMGLPVVCSPVGGGDEVVEDGVTGLYARNDQEWHTKILQIVENDALCRELGLNGRSRAASLYSVQSNLPHLIEVFRRRLQKR